MNVSPCHPVAVAVVLAAAAVLAVALFAVVHGRAALPCAL
jgi:hypothetical protein